MPLSDGLKRAGSYSHLGFTLAGSVLGLFFLGYWLDGKLNTEPLLAILGAFLGATGGFINLVVTMNRMQRKSESEVKDERADGDS